MGLPEDIIFYLIFFMIPRLIFATNNQHKVTELRAALENRFDIITLKEAGILVEIEEPHATLEENAREKSAVINRLSGEDCFSEDTGLEVFSLNMEPGVKSARYAGDHANAADNIKKLLQKMEGKANREARFRTVISFLVKNTEYQFEGICEGRITTELSGDSGFGYDPVFIPEGSSKTFAQMTMEEKNTFSHRKKATEKFADFLIEYYGKNKN